METEGTVYTLQVASDPAFTQNVTTIYRGTDNYTNLTGKTGGTYYYRVRVTRSGNLPTSWKIVANGVVVDLPCAMPYQIYVPANNSTGSCQVAWKLRYQRAYL